MSSLTTEQIKKYVEEGGVSCPGCGSEDIVGGDISVDTGIASQEMSCNECDLEWTDQYTLTGVSQE